MIITVGIDPGAKGGMAALDEHAQIVQLDPITMLDGRCDALAVHGWLAELPVRPALIAVERMQVIPSNGKLACFALGHMAGTLAAVAMLSGAPLVELRPQHWQKAVLGGRRYVGKATALAECRRRWPDAPIVRPGCRVPHDGLVDALLIARAAQMIESSIPTIDSRRE